MKSIILILSTVVAFTGFSQNIEKLNSVYEEAGNNKTELQKVINHFSSNLKDSLKLKASYFLIENMKGHSYSKAKLVDSTETLVNFDVLEYENYKEMVSAWDKIETNIGEIHFKRDTIIYDSQIIKADFLISNINKAFEAWEKPWAKNLDFTNFCEYVLPYRGSNEPLEDWRSYFIKEFTWLEDSLQDITDPIEVVNIINSSLKTWYKFDARMYRHPTDLGLSEMLDTKVGRCEDMTNLAIYAMRANGVPVMSDYVTHWPTTGNNHAWNSTFDKDGNVVIFMGGLQNAGEYELKNKKAKVYRKTYSTQEKALSRIKPIYEKVPAWLRSTHKKDVTKEYVNSIDFSVELKNEKPDSIHFAYLCVFNSGSWQATAWGKIAGDKVSFKDIGTNIVYLCAYYKNDSLIPVNEPFVILNNGEKQFLNSDKNLLFNHTFFSTTKRTVVKTTDEILKSSFKRNKKYELYYWENKWKLIDTKQARKSKPLKYRNLPANALFWLKQKDGREDERIFTIDKEKIIW